MRVLCNSSLSPLPPQTILPFTLNSSLSLSAVCNKKNDSSCTALRWPQRTFIGALTGVLSVGLLVSSPFPAVLAAQTSTLDHSPSAEICSEEKTEEVLESAPDIVSNEEIVKEAWQIVNDSFIDSGRRRWSPETWLKKKEDILSTSIKTRSKAHDLISRMLASLGDPYTRYLSPPEFSKMARYDMTGIGINLREVPGENGDVKLKVLGLILDGPAHSAGVRQGDEVLAVNGVDVRGKSSFEASSLIQGPNETLVNIKVKHGNCGPVQSIEVQRQSIARSPVLYRLEKIDNGATSVGYIRLKEFNALAKKDMLTAMKRLQDSGASSFVLDLRDNRGGLVQAGVEIAKLFLNEGETVIYTVGRDSLDERGITTESRPFTTAPTIVLVNQNTASASEIVASALHDNCKAVLVGETTFGKGLIQSVYELRDGSGVVVTVGKYVTPNHKDINGNGIEPDFQSIPAWSEVSKRLSECSKSREG